MIEVMKQLVDALENHSAIKHPQQIHYRDAAIEAGKQAIAELESQKPVATVTSETGADITMSWWHEPALPMGTKLFTHPPQRTEQEPRNVRERWNIELDGDDLLVCFNDHEKGDKCKYERYSPQRTEQNFCSRCGKRVGGIDSIHTCTPPMEKNT
jgi:hypothetical protein